MITMASLFCVAWCLLGQAPADVRFLTIEGTIEVSAPLSTALQAKLPPGKLTQDQGEEWLRVCLVNAKSGKAGPPMLGAYQRRGDDLVFRPRFALENGQLYRAHFGTEKQAITVDHRLPSLAPAAAARVVKVYPTGDVLPANHLKFYIYFSQPMRGGQAIFKQFAILDADGKEVIDPWLHDEIWDEEANCLILYIHPGRIKWGILLRELLGPVLLPGRRYTLVVRGEMLDAEGRPMGKDFTKSFRTTAEDRERIKLQDWKLTPPTVGTRAPMALDFTKCLDHRALVNFVKITDEQGKRVNGKLEIGAEQKSLSFTPAQPWSSQVYRIAVNPRLEDVAGNTPARPFDMDVKGAALASPRLHLTFRPLMRNAR
jgi:hypothetical protein